MIVIAFHPEVLDAIVRMIRRYTYPKGEAISDRTYNAGSGAPSDKTGRPFRFSLSAIGLGPGIGADGHGFALRGIEPGPSTK